MKLGISHEEFWSRFAVKEDTGCWEWTMARHFRGYGKIRTLKKDYQTHRLAWQIVHGPLPRDVFVCHKCDNPSCGNPDHLFVGSPKDNTHDAMKKGRLAHGERCNLAKLSDAQVKEIAAAEGTQQQIADKYGVTQSCVSRIKNRRIRKEALA